ncbi:MAG: hypothetical protein KTR14_04060, partial [Vampirovibrio sp.]|nr:hypothetical protein [Vampirovibrio sp.]
TPLDLMALPSQSGNNLLSSHQEGAPIEVISPQDELEQRMMSAAEGSPFSSQEPQEIEARENLFLHTFVPTNWMVSSVGGQELGHNGDDTVSMLDRGGGIAETVQDLTDNDLLPLLGALKEIDLNVDITSENIRDFLRLVQKRDLATELAMTDDEYAPEMARFGLVDPEKLSDMTSDYSETVFPAKIENYQKMIIEAKAFMETAGITD